MAVEDHFELCLAKCRTSSQSVQHENTYRDPIAKYCYGESPPELLPA
uniref:SREBF pathway regulator in golgi 1 n=3 Tax=Laurasiatheria TaxID=314145 RepID=A0AC11E7M6_SHEEP